LAEALTPAAERERAAQDVAGPPRKVPFAGRLLVAYVVVIIAFGGALAGLTVLATRDGGGNDRWSSWRPRGDTAEASQQIANHVAKAYRTAAEGQQLIFATARSPFGFSRPITHVAIRASVGQSSTVDAEPTDKTLFYELCAVASGTDRCDLPAAYGAGELAVRREAVELALYSLKYLDDLDMIVVFLPPVGDENTAVYFRKGDLDGELGRPLRKTLPHETPPGLGTADPEEEDVINALTTPHWLHARFQQGNILGSTTLVLDGPVEQNVPGIQQ
jgi:hypothetical protein